MKDQAMSNDTSSVIIEKRVSTDFYRPVHCILGLPFDKLSMMEAESVLSSAIIAKRRCFFSTPNLNFLISSISDPAFRASVIHSDLSVADGMPVIWIARALGIPINERLAGSTLFEKLRQQTALTVRVFFFGGPEGVAQRAATALNAEKGEMICVGARSPGFGSIADMSSDTLIDEINDANADFLVVALGAKRGQAWIEHNLARLDTPVISHLGAVVNFVAGTVSRAPAKLGGLGLEWLWRIKEEPALWRRYANDGIALLKLAMMNVLPGALAAARFKSDLRRQPTSDIVIDDDGLRARITLNGVWHADNLGPLRETLTKLSEHPRTIILDLEKVSGMDSAALGLIILLYGHQSKIQRGFSISAISAAVAKMLRLNCANYLLLPSSVKQSR
jgi:N-acetylglucosaminyldiphosphoundecaprenol N-acetyl-beta-D-mannosaminyltransferase